MISIEQAYQSIEQTTGQYCLPIETIKTKDALNRIIAKDQYSKLDLPPFNKSAMDGYAILANDLHDTYQLLETVAAGEITSQKLKPGTAIKVMTGAPVPENTAQVIPVEQTELIDDRVKINLRENIKHFCLKGEDIKTGQLILTAAQKLGPIEIANLIASGITEVEVYQQPRITIISTGGEITEDFNELKPGSIMNSNGPMLHALSLKHNLLIVGEYAVLDQLDTTIAALKQALDQSDVVIFTGGVSMGDYDYVTEAIKQIGATIHFNRLALKPGKPTTFATLNNKFIFGLPGNPVAVYVTFHLFVLQLIKLITGQKNQYGNWSKFPLAKTFTRKKADRTEFVPCKLTSDYTIKPIEFHGSGHLLALLNCDGFFICPQGQTEILQNTNVQYLSFKND